MKNIILYHSIRPGVDCPDGIAAAWVASRYYGPSALLGCIYQEAPPDLNYLQPGDRIVIVDFSFKAEVINAWCDRGIEVVLFDHHKTALADLGDISKLTNALFRCSFDLKECGATLTWKKLFPDRPVPSFLYYLRDRDLWNWELEQSEEINEAIANARFILRKLSDQANANYRDLLFAWFDALADLDHDDLIHNLGPVGLELLKPKREAIAAAASRVKFEFLPLPGGRTAPIDFAIPVVRCEATEDRLISDICSKLYRDIPTVPFVACITSDGKWSLRSDKNGSNWDVSAIAKHYGGGGHHNAAGFSVD